MHVRPYEGFDYLRAAVCFEQILGSLNTQMCVMQRVSANPPNYLKRGQAGEKTLYVIIL